MDRPRVGLALDIPGVVQFGQRRGVVAGNFLFGGGAFGAAGVNVCTVPAGLLVRNPC